MRRAFTLLETLFVIAIILVVTAISFPVIARAKHGASKARCLSNLRQLGVAAAIYSADHDGSPLATDRSGMGLPQSPYMLVRNKGAVPENPEVFECSQPARPGWMNTAYQCFFCYLDSESRAAKEWEDHVEKMGTRAMLFVDWNHDSPPEVRTAEYVTHKAFGVQIDTSIRHETKKGAPDRPAFWNRQP